MPIEPVSSSGTDNALYRLGRETVARLPRLRSAVDDVGKDEKWLPKLAPLLPVAIPVPIAKGRPAEGYPWPWSVYPWIEGENPSVDGINDPESLAREVARFVKALRRIDPTGGPPSGRGVALAAWAAGRIPGALAEPEGMIDTAAASSAWEAAFRAPASPSRPVWIHGDLIPANLVVQGGHLTAVIDWGGLGVGDPASDLAVAWNLFHAAARNIFREQVACDEATWARGRGWALATGLIALPYYRETNPVLADNARFRIGGVLADH